MIRTDDRILGALRVLGPAGGDAAAVARVAYRGRTVTPALERRVAAALYRLASRGLAQGVVTAAGVRWTARAWGQAMPQDDASRQVASAALVHAAPEVGDR